MTSFSKTPMTNGIDKAVLSQTDQDLIGKLNEVIMDPKATPQDKVEAGLFLKELSRIGGDDGE